MNSIKTSSNSNNVLSIIFSKVLFLDENVTFDLRAKICKEVFINVLVTAYMKQNFYLQDQINDIIENLKASGFMEHWHSQDVHRTFLDKIETKRPSIMTFYHLRGCFEILLIGHFLSGFVIAVEFSHRSIRKITNTLVMRLKSFVNL